MDIRSIALQSLDAIFNKNAYSNIIVSQTIRRFHFEDRDRRFYTELVYGTVRHLNYLDWMVSKLSTRDIKKLDPICLTILRMGLFQIFCLTKIPPSAACNESVKLATRKGNSGMAKFVNAILRSSLRKKTELMIPTLEQDELLHISLTYHQPQWLIQKWLYEYGQEDTLKLCQYFETIPDLCVRTNTIKIDRDSLLERFREHGYDARPSLYAPEGIYLTGTPNLASIAELKEGLCFIQDEPSMLVAHVVDPQPGEIIFDVCAAPGGKTTHLAALSPKSTVYGFDVFEHKLKLIEENVNALSLTNVRVLLQDGRHIADTYKAKADRVLVDAPCSGLGVLKRKLDLRWRKKPSDLDSLPSLQKEILASASACVKQGGVLVYSTCTMNDAENSQVVHSFLQNHPEFKLDNACTFCKIDATGPFIKLLPQINQLDGFFIARMIKGENNG